MELYIQHPTLPLFISNLGNVKKLNFKRKYTYVDTCGYTTLRFTKRLPCGKLKVYVHKVHRLVAELHLKEPTAGLVEAASNEHHGKVCVKHLDNDKTNNKVSNLQWDTSSGNTKDAWKDGLIPKLKGSLNGRATLSEDLVHKVCKAFEDGMFPKEATQVFGISMQQATKIRAGVQWKHIWCQYDIKVNRRSTKTFNDHRNTPEGE